MAADLTKLASQLVRDLKTAFWLPPYDTANVSTVIEQLVEVLDRAKAEQEVPSFDSQDPRDTCAPMVLLLAMIRNRDLLVSYLRYRTQQIEQRRWDTTGSVIGDPRNILSEHEKTCSSSTTSCSRSTGPVQPRLSRDLEPPQDLMIKVYVPEDIGQFVGPEQQPRPARGRRGLPPPRRRRGAAAGPRPARRVTRPPRGGCVARAAPPLAFAVRGAGGVWWRARRSRLN